MCDLVMLIICTALCSWHHVEEISVPLAQRSSISPSPILGTPDLLFLYEFTKAGTSDKCSHIIFVLLHLLILFSVMFLKLLHHRLHQIFTYSNVWIIQHCMLIPLYVCVSVNVCYCACVLRIEPIAFCKSSTTEHIPSPVSATCCSSSFCL